MARSLFFIFDLFVASWWSISLILMKTDITEYKTVFLVQVMFQWTAQKWRITLCFALSGRHDDYQWASRIIIERNTKIGCRGLIVSDERLNCQRHEGDVQRWRIVSTLVIRVLSPRIFATGASLYRDIGRKSSVFCSIIILPTLTEAAYVTLALIGKTFEMIK